MPFIIFLILLLNVHSMLSFDKRLSVTNCLLLNKCPIVCLTETWPNESIPENSVFLGASYTVIAWSDRAAGQHCGLLIALENEFLASENVLFQSNSSFYSCVLLRLPTFILCIVLVYLPPQSSVYFFSPYEFEAMLRVYQVT